MTERTAAIPVNDSKEDVTVVNSPTPMSDDLSPAERAYFESGGQDISGLLNDDNYRTEARQIQQDRDAEEAAHTDQERTQLQAKPQREAEPPAQAAQPATERPAAQPATEQPPAAQPAAKSEEADDINFDDLQVGSDGRLRDAEGRFVPLAALRKEREKFRSQRDANTALEEQNRQLTENYAKLSERVNTLQDLWRKPDAPAQEEKPAQEAPKSIADQLLANIGEAPDPEQDIFAWGRHMQEVVKKQNEAVRELETRLATSTQEIREKDIAPVRQQLTENNIIDYYRNDANSYAAQNTNFGKAYKHLIEQRHATLAMMGFTDANQRTEQIRQEERDLVNTAISRNMRPAEFIYNYAVATGFRPEAASANPTPNPAPAPSPAPAAPAQPAPAAQLAQPATQPAQPAAAASPAERLRNAQAAQAATATLSGTGGAASETLSAETLANMTDDEFAMVAARIGKSGMRQFLGGNV